MTTSRQAEVPADFTPIAAIFPPGAQDDLLGYDGDARFVGFSWDADARAVHWEDGGGDASGPGESFTFHRFIRPLAFLYGVNFGTRGAAATHLFMWDRQTHSAFMAPRQSAERFLREQPEVGLQDLVQHPVPPGQGADRPAEQ